jgi:hypothetical protein
MYGVRESLMYGVRDSFMYGVRDSILYGVCSHPHMLILLSRGFHDDGIKSWHVCHDSFCMCDLTHVTRIGMVGVSERTVVRD